MPALVAVVALGLMAYAPGRFLLRLLVREPCAPPRHRLLLELLLGNVAVGLAGLLLAELALFSLAAVLSLLALVTAGAAMARRSAPKLGYTGADLAGLALFAAVVAWVAPPFDTALYGHDSSVYMGGGLSLARHGSLVFPDPTVSEMPRALRDQFFLTYGHEPGQPPFIRVPGGLLLGSLDDPVVLPAFHHLLSVWVALAQGIAGDAALAAPATYFAALSLWALASFTYALAGGAAALLACTLLLLSAPEYWYSRFLMPEVPSQYFLWAALVAAGASFEPGAGMIGVAAGLGLGMSGLMRLDFLGHIVAALGLWKGLAPGGSWPAARGFAAAFGVVCLWAVGHQLFFPTHYYWEAVELLRSGGRWARPFWVLGAAAVLVPVAVLLLRYFRRAAPALRSGGGILRLVGLVGFCVYLAATLASTYPDPGAALEWLVSYAGWPVLAAAGVGIFLWAARASLPSERFALLLGLIVVAQLFYDSRVTPAPLWAIRRFVPVALPLILIAAVLPLVTAGRRRPWLAGAGLAILLVGMAPRNALTYRGDAFQDSMTHVRSLAAQLPPGAVLVFDPGFAVQTQLHIALWSAEDTPAYLLAADMREPLLALRNALPRRPLYWLGASSDAALAAIGQIADPVASYRFAIGTRRLQWYDARDTLEGHDVTVWLYRLRPAAPAPALQ